MATTSDLETILAFAVAMLADIPGVSHAYGYEPVAKHGESITTFLKTAGWVSYWWAECVSTRESPFSNEEVVLTHDLVLQGYGEVQDEAASGPAFRVLTSLIMDTFRPAYHVPDSATAMLFGPVQAPVRGQLLLLNETFLVHHSECHISATERVTL